MWAKSESLAAKPNVKGLAAKQASVLGSVVRYLHFGKAKLTNNKVLTFAPEDQSDAHVCGIDVVHDP